MNKKEMQMILDAFQNLVSLWPHYSSKIHMELVDIEAIRDAKKAIQALRDELAEPAKSSTDVVESKVLAQPEQEPVAFPDAPTTIYLQVCDDMDCGDSFYDHPDVSWCEDQINNSDIEYIRADTAPPKCERVGLTDEKILALARDHYNPHQRPEISFARAIESAHGIKEKNT